jgi:peptidoglycan hydrolase-like protein with peptidoglycan-binding domain
VRAIREGDRGPAVEDVQRRLRALGADLGSTGVDGVFLGATLAAVRTFQEERGLREDGAVGPETWSALVDATFTLGDRLLYLRFPHLHGEDVRNLQGALNALGFAAGDHDGIFGPFAERAVREFQLNTGLPADGIVGPATVRALENLRHVWSDKAPEAPAALRRAPARSTGCLSALPITLSPLDADGRLVAERLENLVQASTPEARVCVSGGVLRAGEGLLVRVGTVVPGPAGEVPEIAAADGGDALAARVETALRSSRTLPRVIDVLLPGGQSDEHTLQRVAVGLLDGLCLGLAGVTPAVVP